MESDGHRPSLLKQTKKSLDGISFWSWSELLVALKKCQDLLLSPSKPSLILDKVLDCVVGRLVSPIVASPTHLPLRTQVFNAHVIQGAAIVSETIPLKYLGGLRIFYLNIDLIDKVIKLMICQHFDHATITKFLFCYQRSRFVTATPTEKCKIMEVIINLLSLLDRNSLSCKHLFDMIRVASSLEKISKHCKFVLETLIGSQLDQATIDFLLVSPPQKKHYMYDMNLVLSLLDSYLVEVSADFYLTPSKFAALFLLLPDFARESHDRLFQAIDIYLQVHGELCEAEKMRICSALNYAKLSIDVLRHLARNSKFSSRIAIQGFINQQSKLENGSISIEESIKENENSDQVLVYAKRVDVPGKVEQLENIRSDSHTLPRQTANYAAKCTRGYGAQYKNANLEDPKDVCQ
ncbi:hypothetical protein CXB51_011895 [Gossypium anomalum]|uniref:NPH3 domain-containing protein n=1 Tax=Gossypium anomalum TaxID=47600 RepID=A0A8J5ZB08_9ROSI|nr:hypothetical protein CXB51_011895 [Gossypium anomalum]